MYACTSDSSIYVNIVVVGAVLAFDPIHTDTKKGVVFWTCSQMQFEGMVFQTRSQTQSCGAQWDEVYDHRPTSACTT